MKTLFVFEIDGVMNNRRAALVARKALHDLEHELVFISSRLPSRTQESVAFLSETIKTSTYPKPAPALCCGGTSQADTMNKKAGAFRSLLNVHYAVDRLVVYESDIKTLEVYGDIVVGRSSPRSHSFYLVTREGISTARSSAVYVKDGPKEF